MNKKVVMNLFLIVLLVLFIIIVVNFFKNKIKLEGFYNKKQKLKKMKKTFDEWNRDQNQKLKNLYKKEKKSKEKGIAKLPGNLDKSSLYPYKYMVKPYKKVDRPEKCPKAKVDCSKCVPDCNKCLGQFRKQYFTFKNNEDMPKMNIDEAGEFYPKHLWF